MERWRKGSIWILVIMSLWCFSAVAMASSYDATSSILSKLQGQWYDAEGNIVLDFQGKTVNGCEIVGAYHRPEAARILAASFALSRLMAIVTCRLSVKIYGRIVIMPMSS